MNGILNILKPPGMTSQNVVSYVKRKLNVKKVGHTGTLDPGAAGVLPICIGKATRVSEYLLNDKKSYRAEMCLGLKSDTLDKYGKVESVEFLQQIDDDTICKAFTAFMGSIKQTPPMYSAVKHNGSRLYKLARQGIVVERNARDAYIYDIKILKINDCHIFFDVTCSKGTYIRSLCSDIGKTLGSDAIMTFLIRTKTGPFHIEDSITLNEFDHLINNGNINEVLYPIYAALEGYRRVYVDEKTALKARDGVGFEIENVIEFENGDNNEIILIFDANNDFVSIGKLLTDNYIKIDKVFL